MSNLTEKQKRFCDEYLIDLNATQAAIRCGYSEKTARSQGQRLLTNVDIQAYIQEQMQTIQKDKIASAEEVIEYLTSVMRGEQTDEVVTATGKKNTKIVDAKDRIKAAELLGKRYGLYTEKVNVTAVVPVFKGEENLED